MNIWIATFIEEEMVDINDYKLEIENALRKLGYEDLKTWVEMNNFEGKFTGYKIGKSVLKILLEEAKNK